MSAEILVEYSDNCIRAKQYWTDDYKLSLELWNEIVSKCKEHDCYNVLCEFFTSNSMQLVESYNFVKIFGLTGVTFNYRIAWVHHGEETIGGIKFTETVLKNRGLLNGGLFNGLDEAHLWLNRKAG